MTDAGSKRSGGSREAEVVSAHRIGDLEGFKFGLMQLGQEEGIERLHLTPG